MKLTDHEQAHVDNGGRVFIIEEIPGPLWRVVSVSKERGVRVLLKPQDEDGYETKERAEDHANSIAVLSEDGTIVRPS
ncbi:hypothetical protein [Burkholderia plantarii]|uniref:hypothetical protein n=1 Tax=Burkholderia plantarii TaxID=41899 RepID=UPI000AAB67A1|nr:hypothetical protein [Burkholderia plantarii]GLZ22642.1 hypothetical protein Bpla01_61710 [Burkholderia plantarii]